MQGVKEPAIVGVMFLCLLFASGLVSGKSDLLRSISEDESKLFGNWTGESLCQLKGTACKDEKVIYRLARASTAGKITITADKVVDGRTVTMGVSDWDYDGEKQTLTWRNWKVTIKGNQMDGTLTADDGTLIRKMWLKKDEN